jgi:predicted transcriptional regulator
MDPTYTYVKAQLERRKKQLIKVAANAEVSLRTIYNLRDGKNVRHETLMKVHDYLKANHKKREL